MAQPHGAEAGDRARRQRVAVTVGTDGRLGENRLRLRFNDGWLAPQGLTASDDKKREES
jgi:hypothetical protein